MFDIIYQIEKKIIETYLLRWFNPTESTTFNQTFFKIRFCSFNILPFMSEPDHTLDVKGHR